MEQVGANMMVLSANHQPHPREERLRPIRAGAILAVRYFVVDAPHVVVAVKRIPVARFIRMNLGCTVHPLLDHLDAFIFVADNGCKRPATSLPHHHNYAALPRLEACKAPVDPVLGKIGWADVAPEITAIDLYYSMQDLVLGLLRQRLAQFVHKDECRFVLAAYATRKLKRGDTFCRVRHHDDRGNEVYVCHLA
jgi:hypothetical protein